jgi:hypothetical protein
MLSFSSSLSISIRWRTIGVHACYGSVANPTNGISSSTQRASTGTIPGHPRTDVDRRCANPATAVRQCRLASQHDPRKPSYGGGSHGCVAYISSACSPQVDKRRWGRKVGCAAGAAAWEVEHPEGGAVSKVAVSCADLSPAFLFLDGRLGKSSIAAGVVAGSGGETGPVPAPARMAAGWPEPPRPRRTGPGSLGFSLARAVP